MPPTIFPLYKETFLGEKALGDVLFAFFSCGLHWIIEIPISNYANHGLAFK